MYSSAVRKDPGISAGWRRANLGRRLAATGFEVAIRFKAENGQRSVGGYQLLFAE
jgi:hypothetical protein